VSSRDGRTSGSDGTRTVTGRGRPFDGFPDEEYADGGFDEADEYGPEWNEDAVYGDTGPVPTAKKRRRAADLNPAVSFVLLVLVVGLIAAGVVFEKARRDIVPGTAPGKTVTVVLPNNATNSQIAGILAADKVIHGPSVFQLYLRLEGISTLQPGTYHLATNERYSSVVSALQSGPPAVTDKLVVPEGYTINQIGAAVAKLPDVHITAAQFETAATNDVRSPYEPATVNSLEGLLFPATYPVRSGETADELVEYMVEVFDQHAASLGLTAAAKKLGYTPYQVVTIASIVEREAKLAPDRPLIADVIYNRLAIKMPLGADSTLLYGLGEPAATGNFNYNQPNPYNTRLNAGLPPTAISNPGIPSLQAAMNPTPTTYLYWVEINPDGKMGYASTSSGFAQLQTECRQAGLGC
jgi:UPF0755 protein